MSQLWGFHHPEPAVPDSAPDTAAPRGAIYTGWHPQTNMNCFSLRGGTLTGVHTTAHASVADASRFFIEVLPHDLGRRSKPEGRRRSKPKVGPAPKVETGGASQGSLHIGLSASTQSCKQTKCLSPTTRINA